MDESTSLLLSIWNAGVDSVRPYPLVRKFLDSVWCPDTSKLTIKPGLAVTLEKNLFVVGFGKAVLAMAEPIYEILGAHIREGILSVPVGSSESTPWIEGKDVVVKEGAKDNLPDPDAMEVAEMIAHLVESLQEQHVLIVLISGGGSALLPLPVEGVTISEKSMITRDLAKKGATIQELNTVRQCLSKVKGGGLARMAAPAKVLSLILSDVIGDPLNFIASGPTFHITKNYEQALTIVKAKLKPSEIPDSIMGYLTQKAEQLQTNSENIPEAQAPESIVNNIIGSNRIAVDACKRFAEDLGMDAMVVSSVISGDARDMAYFCAELALHHLTKNSTEVEESSQWTMPSVIPRYNLLEVLEFLQSSSKPKCLIFGGETTVKVTGKGKGGRNQEMALYFAKDVNELPTKSCYFLSAGTDGIDGPTDAAGAFGYPGMIHEFAARGLDIGQALGDNDSNTYYAKFDNGSHLVKPGHTGTNVMDIQLLYFPG